MVRPRKDPSVAPKERVFDVFKIPVSSGRTVFIRVPRGGLKFMEVELLKRFIPVLLEVDADEGELQDLLDS